MPTTKEGERTMLKTFLEHAPKPSGKTAATLLGWTTPLGNFLCTVCADRILGRGCNIPHGSEPLWHEKGLRAPLCCTCEHDEPEVSTGK